MIEEISSESATIAPLSPKVHRIGLYNRLAIMISGGFIVLCLLIGWALWLLVFHKEIDYYINTFNSNVPDGLQMSFKELSIIIFGITVFAVGLVVIPFVFIRTKNSTSTLFSFISFVFSTLLVVVFTIFVFLRFNVIKSLVKNDAGVAINTIGIAVVVFLPWALVAVDAVFLLGNSIWLLINISSKYRSNVSLVQKLPSEKPKPVVQPTPILQENEISVPLATTQPEVVIPIIPTNSQQPINITVTNNTGFPNEQPNIQKNQIGVETPSNIPTNIENTVDSQTNIPNTYTRSTIAESTTGAYVSEAVATNQNSENSNEHNQVRLADPMLVESSLEPEVALAKSTSDSAIYSHPNLATSSLSKYDDLPEESNNSIITEPEVLSDTNTSPMVTSYEQQNQGGFDVQSSEQGQLDESEFRQVKPTITDYEYKAQENLVMKPSSPATKSQIRKPKSTPNVNRWTLDQIQTVWEKAETIDGVSDKLYRKDYAGAWMFRDSFTNDLSEANNEKTYSWTIVLHRPASQSGTTELYNLDPMNIVNAENKGENYPRWTTKLSSKGNENIVKMQNWKART